MKTEQEQIEQIEKVLKYSVVDYKQLKKKGVCYCYAETLIDNGYGDVSEYKDEIERLKNEMSDIRKKTAEEFAKRICEMLWNLGIDKDGNRFSYGDLASENVLYVAKQFGVDVDNRLCKENNMATAHINKLVEQDAEIGRLRAENTTLYEIRNNLLEENDKLLKDNVALILDKRQAQIDVLNKLRRRAWQGYQIGMYIVSTQEIDELIKEVEKQ